jgi:triosephosphate isomerase
VSAVLSAPFFEIGPKNFLRRRELEALARAAGQAARQYDVAVVMTVPTAMVAPVAELRCGVHVFAQHLDGDTLGGSVGRVTAESLADAGAVGVMLDHESDPLTEDELVRTIGRAREAGLQTMVCAGSEADAIRRAELRPTVVLVEPAALIGTVTDGVRDWIRPTTEAIRSIDPGVLAMHAGGVASPSIAHDIMASGADGTGSTSGVLTAADPLAAATAFVAAARAGWDAHVARTAPTGA